MIASGEEGFADITQLLCDEHLTVICAGLKALGFADHHRGGINFLESNGCGPNAYANCSVNNGEQPDYGEEGYVVVPDHETRLHKNRPDLVDEILSDIG